MQLPVRFSLVFLYFSLVILQANGQALQVPLYQSVHREYERQLADSILPAFSSVKPYQEQWLNPRGIVTEVDSTGVKKFTKRLLNGHLLRYKDDQFSVTIDPIISYGMGKSSNNNTYISSRGINVGLRVGKQFGVGFAFTENQGKFPAFVNTFVKDNDGVLPGMGLVRNFKNGGYDYAYSDAYIRWAPGRIFSATLGYGKNFLGEGYRSLYLSDNSYNYPFFQLNFNFKRFHYTVLYNQYQNLDYKFNDAFQKKWSTIHYLTVNVGKRWQVGFFESVVFQAQDSTGNRGFDFAYINPIPFMRPIEFSLGSPDNMLMGLHGTFKMAKRTFLYTQLLLDDLNIQKSRDSMSQHINNKYAIQLGIKSFVTAGRVKLFFRAEYNYARPYVYGHRKIPQNYTNYHQALAHPLGANFDEIIFQISAQKGRWYAESTTQIAWIGRQDGGYPKGNDLFLGEAHVPEYGSYTLQGLKTNQLCNQINVGWILNPAWNMAIELSVLQKSYYNSQNSMQDLWIQLGIKTRLKNMYLDF